MAEREFYDDEERRRWEEQNDPYAPIAAPAPAPAASSVPSAYDVPPGNNQWGISIPSPNPASYDRDLAYWMQNGVVPQGNPDSIFDANGQVRPGWERTARGYERKALASSEPNRNYGADPASIAYSGGGGGGMQGPDYRLLPYSPYTPYGAFSPRTSTFSFDPYKASSWEDAENEPGYRASRDQLKKQVEQGAAFRGMVRSGMTIGDLYSNLDALGQQNFKNFDDRNFRNWSGNRDLAAQRFQLEYGVDRDVYDRGSAENERANNYKFNTEDASFKDALQRWTEMTRSLTSIARPS